MKEKHTFALWHSTLSSALALPAVPQSITMHDETGVHRIIHVLRLNSGDQVILFDEELNALCTLEKIDKKEILLRVMRIQNNIRKGIAVTVLLPLLKKDDHDAALYSLAALGVETIQFITTEKTQRTLHGSQELARAQKIIRAAAEQSKYFCLPLIKGPVNLMVYLEQQHTRGDLALVADPDGHSVRELIADRAAVSQATILVGPEGGLTVSERDLVAQHGFVSCRLTPTILKAEHAVSLLAGIVRSIF